MKSIIIAYPVRSTALQIKNVLEKNGYTVSHICATGASVLQIADSMREGLIISASILRDMTAVHIFENLSADFDVLALGGEAELYSDGVLTLPLPLDKADFVSTVAVLMSSGSVSRPAEKKSDIVSDAKSILMNLQEMSEPQAHTYLQHQSMLTGKKLEQTAQQIIRQFRGFED